MNKHLNKFSFSAILLVVFLGLGALCSVTGCENLTGFLSDNSRIFNASVKVAATKVIVDDSGVPDLDRALRVNNLGVRIKSLAIEERAPIRIIEQFVRDTIKWEDYSPDEQVLIEEVITLVRQEIEARIELGDLPKDYTFIVAEFADQLIIVSDRYL